MSEDGERKYIRFQHSTSSNYSTSFEAKIKSFLMEECEINFLTFSVFHIFIQVIYIPACINKIALLILSYLYLVYWWKKEIRKRFYILENTTKILTDKRSERICKNYSDKQNTNIVQNTKKESTISLCCHNVDCLCQFIRSLNWHSKE